MGWLALMVATVTIPFAWRLDRSTGILMERNGTVTLLLTPRRDEGRNRDVDIVPQQHQTPQLPGSHQTPTNSNASTVTITTKPQQEFTLFSNSDSSKQQQQPTIHAKQHQQQHAQISVKSFLEIPLRFIVASNNHSTTSSTVHCVGDNFSPQHSWKYRACQFQHLCWNRKTRDFLLFPSPLQLELEQALASWNHPGKKTHAHISTRMNDTAAAGGGVSLSGLTVMTVRKRKSPWFPTMMLPSSHTHQHHNNDPNNQQQQQLDGFYQLEHTIWIPFDLHVPSLSNPTALLFDLIFPLYNLLAMFGWERRGGPRRRLLLTNMNRDCTPGTPCQEQLLEYLPLLGSNVILHTLHDNDDEEQVNPDTSSSSSSSDDMICAPRGAAGIGFLTDHGWKRHGTKSSDYRETRNVGRGILFYKFRQDALAHMRIRKQSFPIVSSSNNLATWRIVLVLDSPLNPDGYANAFPRLAAQLLEESTQRDSKTTATNDKVQVLPTMLFNQSLYEQLQIVAQTCIYICVNNGDHAIATFLPRGASLILLYDDEVRTVPDSVGKRKKEDKKHHQPVMLDWDLWNNMAHLHVHWLPLTALNEQVEGRNALIRLVHSDLDRMKRKRQDSQTPTKDQPRHGTFNGLDVVHVPNRLPWSAVHCVGSNFQDDATMYRSCHYDKLCFDMDRKAFVVLSSPQNSSKYHVSNRNERVMIGHNARLANRDNVSWSPIEISTHGDEVKRKGYYELPANVVWVPFFGETPNILNPGHLLWDYLLPLFTLASMFGLLDAGDNNQNDAAKLLLTNMDHEDCIPERPGSCFSLISKFLPLMGAVDSFSHDRNVRFTVTSALQNIPKSNLVCGNGVAGIGMLTDHALQRHGQGSVDYEYVVNAGRGPSFYNFRNYLLRNIQITDYDPHLWSQFPLHVTVSVNSSQTPSRNRDFHRQIDRLRQELPTSEALVQSFVMSELPLNEQIRIATTSVVYMSAIGGATVTATFLPKGASLVLFLNDVDQFVDDDPAKGPVYMDWDFWNNASYLRVHWLPISTMDESADLEVLVKLVGNELGMKKLKA